MNHTHAEAEAGADGIPLSIQRGLRDEGERARLARIVWEGFAGKFQAVRLPEAVALELFALSADPRMALCAYRGEALVGVLGMVTAEGCFMRVPWARLRAHFGPLRALLYHFVLNTQGSPSPGQLLIAPLAVAPASRRQGVGRALMQAVEAHARAQGYTHLCLNVVDTNHVARRLYVGQGFYLVKTTRFGFLTRRAGFTSSLAMIKHLRPIGRERSP